MGGREDVELTRGAFEQLPVFQAGPTYLLGRPNSVARKFGFQFPGKGFIKQDAYLAPAPRGLDSSAATA